jgi:hypothetical protein
MNNDELPKITFGIIVLNGEPFVRYCLRSLYPFAYEIIVVEGGHEDTKSVCTPDGHSIDGTLETLHRFKKEEDTENKLTIVTKDGFWLKKDELGNDRTPQSRAYAERATGDYLWQIDIDEFYKEEDMLCIIKMIKQDPSITTVTFPFVNFWGDIMYRIEGWKFLRGDMYCHRLFKWGEGYKYVTHEPPTIINDKGIELRTIKWISGKKLKKSGIYMYHYSHLFPWQVRQKTMIYKDEKPDDCSDILEWADNNYFKITNPFNIERHYWLPSWLEYYKGSHPKEVINMMRDIKSGKIKADLRNNDDVEKILRKRFYPLKTTFMKVYNKLDYYSKYILFQAGRVKNIPEKIKRNFFKKK